jgi:hypothetical protein
MLTLNMAPVASAFAKAPADKKESGAHARQARLI